MLYDRLTDLDVRIDDIPSVPKDRDRLIGRRFDGIVPDHDIPGRNGLEFLERDRVPYTLSGGTTNLWLCYGPPESGAPR